MAELTNLEPNGPDDRPQIDYTKRADPTNLEGGRARRAAPTNLDGSPSENVNRRYTEGDGMSSSGGYQPLPPSLLKRGFRLERRLGSGTEAVVWLVAEPGGRPLAVKVYTRRPTYNEALLRQYSKNFHREFTVEVVERGVDEIPLVGAVHYEVLEYCPGGTLEDLLERRRGGSSDQFASMILSQLAVAIDGIQRATDGSALVHGDIKPLNILVRSENPIQLVLNDFGLIVDLGLRSALSNNGQGTTAYMAPELSVTKGGPSDWWSLGMVMFRVLVGRGYYQRDGGMTMSEEAIRRELQQRDVDLNDIDSLSIDGGQRKRWKALLAGLLTKDVDRRWGAKEVRQWLSGANPKVYRVIDEEPVSASGPSAAARAHTSFPFPGVGEFWTTRELGLAMAQHPVDAARLLTGTGLQRLLGWLSGDAGSNEQFAELKPNWEPDAKAAYVVSQLVPDAPLSFQGLAITSAAQLRDTAGSADARTLEALLKSELIGALAADGIRPRYRMIDANWRDLVDRARSAANQRGILLTPQAEADVVQNALRLAAGDDTFTQQHLDKIRARLDQPSNAPAREMDWFRLLRADAGL